MGVGEKGLLAERIVSRLVEAGYTAYLAGGCVRDMVMGREPHDYDIATDARPETIMAIFPRTIPTGVQFGVVLVILEGIPFEVATFRSDGEYVDGRHPKDVTFSGEREDALRRDFTINGLFYDPLRRRVIDYVGGEADIRSGIIRTIGDPEERFAEDRLRLIRAVRFAARFGYRIDEGTYEALVRMAQGVSQVSRERVRDELVKILTDVNPKSGVELLLETGLLEGILPEVAAMEGVPQPPEFHPEGDVMTHVLIMLKEMRSPSTTLAMGVLLHDVGKPPTFEISDRVRFNNHDVVGEAMARDICRRLRFSNKDTEVIASLVREHLRFKDVKRMRESRLKRFLRLENFEEHLELHRLDCLASHGSLENWGFCREMLSKYSEEEIKPERLITGRDLIEMGYEPGPLFSEMLEMVEDAQLEGAVTDREEARRLVMERYPLPSQRGI